MSNRIKELRVKHKLTQKQFSEQINIPVTTLAQYERGEREPKLATWQKLADFFGVDVPYLQGLNNFNIAPLPKLNDQAIKDQEMLEFLSDPFNFYNEELPYKLSKRNEDILETMTNLFNLLKDDFEANYDLINSINKRKPSSDK